MHGLVLAPGDPDATDRPLPPPFVELAGTNLFEHQLAALAPICDAVTVVVGKGFLEEGADESASSRAAEVDIQIRQRHMHDPAPTVAETRLASHLSTDAAVDLTAVVLPHWAAVGTAEACRQGLRARRDHTLILEGDVLPRPEILARMDAEYRMRIVPKSQSALGVIPGERSDVLSVDWNIDGRVTTYGEDATHGLAGLHLLHRDHVADLAGLLDQHPREAYPLFLPAIDATFLPVPPDGHVRVGRDGEGAAAAALERWAGTTPRTPRRSP